MVKIIGLFALACTIQARDIVVHAGRLLDVEAKRLRTNVSILIQDERIIRLEDGFIKPAGAEIVDLSQMTVLPGFIASNQVTSETHSNAAITARRSCSAFSGRSAPLPRLRTDPSEFNATGNEAPKALAWAR